MERIHRATFENQWTIVLKAIYTAILCKNFLPIKALRKHPLSHRHLSYIISINFSNYFIYLFLHLSDLILLCLNNFSVLTKRLLECPNTIVLV